MPTIDDALRVLSTTFGYSAFRPGQEDVVRAVLDGEDVLAVMPTGAGKSLCYQLPALVREGLTIVVSPLIALMRDQVAALRNNGVAAGALNSANDEEEASRVRAAMREGTLKLLYVSPERLSSESLADFLARRGVSLLAIDEAHCVSQWGHDFRPEYARLGEVRRRLGDVQTMALTATADGATREDIAQRLFPRAPRTFVQGFDRPNLRLAMSPKTDAPRQLSAFLGRHREESGIVYCATRNAVEKLAEKLGDLGYRALPYHAGLEQAVRQANQDTFLQEDGVVMVATVAFGMGVDKPDVRFVAHAAMPKTIEAYYQEIGRAGRDGAPADTLTLYGLDDMRLRRQQIAESQAPEEVKRIEYRRFDALVALCEAPRCRRQTLLAYFGETSEPCGHCDLCEGGVTLFDATRETQMILSAIARTGERFGSEHIVSILVGDETEQVRRLGHDTLRTFGVGRDKAKNEWRGLIRQVYAGGLVENDITGYGAWRITERGDAVLRGRETVTLRADVHAPKDTKKARRAAALADSGPSSDPLLKALRALRTRLAKDEGVPAYVVFTDRTMIDIVERRPDDLGALGACHGVGKAKLERYGEEILATIREAG
ncbi:DNA helicase RecQ [Salinarimonas ramus]|uniref:DNA helicase RecQ n=1 Tax=Salinarimonas ramus TaxID=690164 RepID=A0A917QJQ8_9HYPH|nr:DNA helicase RecQ [Salinarimonas ramus]GGK53920.1 ATP-dependent DNA helicase RecQ [Salinarimonas ramus]